ncbi:MAG: hypothetical protein EA356_17730 [Geminicoccaceae bacterium]|nr:MAG: hypothetical protein EA356_17730 [Geminicoccaceae bacterium]
MADRAAALRPATSSVVQRLVLIDEKSAPRDHRVATDVRARMEADGTWGAFLLLHNNRTRAYHFLSVEHLVGYLRGEPMEAPKETEIDQGRMAEAHGRVQDSRFCRLHERSAEQIPSHGEGAHQTPENMLPPLGEGQLWHVSTTASGQHLGAFSTLNPNKRPAMESEILTFGEPSEPSVVVSRGGLNLGMHIRPTTQGSTKRRKLERSKAKYGGLTSVSGRVRGHPFTLHDNQASTDPTSSLSFDTEPRAYTDESDSTGATGGTSSYRYNKIEKRALVSGLPFTQVNIDPTPSTMNIARPSEIAFRSQTASGSVVDRRIDNTGTTDYRNAPRPKGVKGGKQAIQDEMALDAAKRTPFPEAPTRHFGEAFEPDWRDDVSGYESPPPTPYFAYEEPTPKTFTLPAEVKPGERVEIGGEPYIVQAITARTTTGTTFTAVPDPNADTALSRYPGDAGREEQST